MKEIVIKYPMVSQVPEQFSDKNFIELSPFDPQTFSLIPGEHIQIWTETNMYIASISYTDDGIIIQSDNGRTVSIDGSGSFTLGVEDLGKHFFGSVGSYVSRHHLEIQVESIGGNIVQFTLMDLDSTNGTRCKKVENNNNVPTWPVDETVEQTHIESIAAVDMQQGIMIAGGMEGSSESPNGKNKAITVKGPRTNNEDGSLVADTIIAVSDGMGGYEDGEIAAQIALETVSDHIHRSDIDLRDILNSASNEIAYAHLHPDSGTTLAVARKIPQKDGMAKYELAHVGDTKILALSKSKRTIVYESEDQSVVQEDIKNGKIKKSIERYTHKDRNKITNSIGAKGNLAPGYKELSAEDGDLLILIYSDGVADYASPEEVAALYFNLLDNDPERAKNFHEELANYGLSKQKQPNGINIPLDGKNHYIILRGDHGDNATVAKME